MSDTDEVRHRGGVGRADRPVGQLIHAPQSTSTAVIPLKRKASPPEAGNAKGVPAGELPWYGGVFSYGAGLRRAKARGAPLAQGSQGPIGGQMCSEI
jgi:hypothetical protein